MKINLGSIFRIAKAVAPVVVPIVTVAVPAVKEAIRQEKAKKPDR